MVPLLYGAPCSSIENRKYKCQIVNTNRIPTFDKMLLSEILLSALFFRRVCFGAKVLNWQPMSVE